MRIQYNKLWKLLIDRGIKKKELAELYKEKYEKLIKFNYYDNLISDKIETIDYYKSKEFELKKEIATINAKINSFN